MGRQPAVHRHGCRGTKHYVSKKSWFGLDQAAGQVAAGDLLVDGVCFHVFIEIVGDGGIESMPPETAPV